MYTYTCTCTHTCTHVLPCTYTAMLEIRTWSYLFICNPDKHNSLLKISKSNILKHDVTFSCTILSNDKHTKFTFLTWCFVFLICILNRHFVCIKHSLSPWCSNKVKTLHWISCGDHRYENVCLEIAGDSANKIHCYLTSYSCATNILGGGGMVKHWQGGIKLTWQYCTDLTIKLHKRITLGWKYIVSSYIARKEKVSLNTE